MKTALKTLVIAPGALQALKQCNQHNKADSSDICFSIVPRYEYKTGYSNIPTKLVIYSPSLYPKATKLVLPKEIGYIELVEQAKSTAGVAFCTAALYACNTEDNDQVIKVFDHIIKATELVRMYTK